MSISKFSDLNQVDPTDQPILIDFEAIYQSITNIIHTPTNQRLFLPEFGIDLMKYLFEPMTDEILFSMKNEIISAIRRWEPRVELVRQLSKVSTDEINHEVNIFLVFTVLGYDEDQYVFQTVLNRNKLGQFYAN